MWSTPGARLSNVPVIPGTFSVEKGSSNSCCSPRTLRFCSAAVLWKTWKQRANELRQTAGKDTFKGLLCCTLFPQKITLNFYLGLFKVTLSSHRIVSGTNRCINMIETVHGEYSKQRQEPDSSVKSWNFPSISKLSMYFITLFWK